MLNQEEITNQVQAASGISEPKSSRNLPKRNRTIVGLAALFLFALCAGCSRTADPHPVSQAIQVEVTPVKQQNVPVYSAWVGTLEGYLNAQIQPQVSGYLIRQDYREGTFVHKDQLLFEIDPRPFQAALDQAKAQLAQAQAQLTKTTLDVKRDLPEAQAQAIPQSQLDDDRAAQLAAKAALEAGQAAVEQAALNLGYTKVRSLIDGIAGIATTQVGNLVGPSTVLTSVSQVNPIKVAFPITEQQYLTLAGGIAPGTLDLLSATTSVPLQLTLANGNVYPHSGRILFTNRQVDRQTGTIQVIGDFPNPHRVLRPGQFARVRARTQILQDALLVPQSAVTQIQGGYQVALVGPGNKVQIRTVQVGPSVGTLWVITSGLKPGERVVAEGSQKVRNGETVRPEPYSGGSH